MRYKGKRRVGAIVLMWVAALLFVACSARYEVGDYYNRSGVEGVVVAVDDDGSPKLILSVDEVRCINADSAMAWAHSLSADTALWHLPTMEEMQQVSNNSIAISKTLAKKKKASFNVATYFYWTATECSSSHSYALSPDGIRCFFKQNVSDLYRARAVTSLTKEAKAE